MERAVTISWFLCQREVEGVKMSSPVDPGECGYCNIKCFWMCWTCSLPLQFFMPSIPTARDGTQRDRGIHICVCAFSGATRERKAASEGVLFSNPLGKLVKEFTFVVIYTHSASKPWSCLPGVHELCPEQGQELSVCQLGPIQAHF